MKMRYKTALLTALCVTALVGTTAAAAAYQYRYGDITALQNALHVGGTTAAQDLDGSGTVDVFDLGLMKRIAGTPTSTGEDVSVPVTTENVLLQSRYAVKDGTLHLVQSGSAADALITGASASVTVTVPSVPEKAENQVRVGVLVDGEMVQDVLLDKTETTLPLWEGSTVRQASVRVMLLSEAMYGGVGVKSFDIQDAGAAPVVPMPKKELCIGFIGDSITCAYGVEGAQGESFKTGTENFAKSYAYLTAAQLGADYQTCCYSGHGIVSGYTADGAKNAESLIPDCYDVNSKFYLYGDKWGFSVRPLDAVVINLGTNDINYVAADPDTRNAEFIEGYVAFLETVHTSCPDAAIVCTVGTMGGEEIYALIEQAVAQFQTAHKDAAILCYFSRTHTMADGIGADWHPSAKTQQDSAYVLADKLCQVLGRESTQLGLDVAADADYQLAQGDGANAASYVGYDKSFWVNTVTGGTSPDAVRAELRGIGLRKGGEYVLSFDVTASPARAFPLTIEADGQSLFDAEAEASGEETHYELPFTSPATADATLAFQLGGVDSANVTLKNIKVTKVSTAGATK